MLYYIKRILEENMIPELPDFPVYVDSPLAVSATGVFEDNEQDCFDEEARKMLDKGINPLTFRGLHLTITTEESIAINDDAEPKVIISASGMCDAGRIRHHIRHNITRPESTILFVGYQAEGSLGRKLLDGVPEIKIMGDTLSVMAQITQIDGMSGHADRDGLLRWIKGFKTKPKHVFVVHGDDEVADSYARLLRDEDGYAATAPFSGTEFDLLSGEFTKVTKGEPIRKKAAPAAVTADSYTKLKISLKRLEQVIDKSAGMANKDIDEFTKAVNDLCRKFGR
jgi:metallo-beta-lactamase family protein